MAFRDFPFPPAWHSFVTHEEMQHYLAAYAEHHAVLKHVHFKTSVLSVEPVNGTEEHTQWRVRTVPTGADSPVKEATFDAAVVCNGHYTQTVRGIPNSVECC